MTSWFHGRSLLVTALAATLLTGCGDDARNQDESGAIALLARVQGENYRSWARPPGWEERRTSNGVHAKETDIFINAVAEEALATEPTRGPLPQGSLIVKDGYNANDYRLTAIMEKRTDGWYWAEYDPTGTPTFSGHPDLCINCHQAGTDFVRAF